MPPKPRRRARRPENSRHRHKGKRVNPGTATVVAGQGAQTDQGRGRVQFVLAEVGPPVTLALGVDGSQTLAVGVADQVAQFTRFVETVERIGHVSHDAVAPGLR
jgi:hypothetical protein